MVAISNYTLRRTPDPTRVTLFLVLLAPVLLLLAAPEARAGRLVLIERTWGDCVVVAEMTDVGRALRVPSPEEPVYFLGRVYGCRLGSMVGDRLPDSKEMGPSVARILARQGYRAAQPGMHEPELFLALQWGGRISPRSREALWFLGYDRRDDIATPAFPGQLGPEIYRRQARSREIETILNYAEEGIYGIIISAFEYKSALTPQPVILWQTRVGLPANVEGMTDALTTMAHVAGPLIGRETTKPTLRTADDRYTTKLGKLEVIGFENDESDSESDK